MESEQIDEVVVESSTVPVRRGRGNPNLHLAREKALETKRKMAIISKAKREAARQERDAEYAKALEVLNGPAKKVLEEEDDESVPEETAEKLPVSKKAKKPTKVIEITDSSSSESDVEESSDEDVQVVRVVRKKKEKAPPAPKKKKKAKRIVEESSEDSDEDERRLGGQVARDMLRRRVLEKEMENSIRRLVPTFSGWSK